MTYVFFILWALLVVAVSMLFLYYFTNRGMTLDLIDFDRIQMPYVTLSIQDNLMNFIIDTACGISVLNKQAIDDIELLYRVSGRKVGLSGITDKEVVSVPITVEFELNKKHVQEDFFIHDVEDFANFKAWHDVTIHGLLGNSFLDEHNCKIDFKKHKLTIL